MRNLARRFGVLAVLCILLFSLSATASALSPAQEYLLKDSHVIKQDG